LLKVFYKGWLLLVRRLQQAEPIHNHEIHCSRERSRTAWNVIEEVRYFP
jgi:hypothetical protein